MVMITKTVLNSHTQMTLLLFGLLISLFAKARDYTGNISIVDSSHYLVKNESKLKIQALDLNLQSLIKRLKQNDYVSLDGTIAHSELVVNSINFVGLQELKGLWQDQDGLCYHFYSFTKFKTFFPTYKTSCTINDIPKIKKIKTNQFNYVTTPNAEAWSIVISNDQVQYLIDFESTSDPQKIFEVYNSLTGQKITTLYLNPAL